MIDNPEFKIKVKTDVKQTMKPLGKECILSLLIKVVDRETKNSNFGF